MTSADVNIASSTSRSLLSAINAEDVHKVNHAFHSTATFTFNRDTPGSILTDGQSVSLSWTTPSNTGTMAITLIHDVLSTSVSVTTWTFDVSDSSATNLVTNRIRQYLSILLQSIMEQLRYIYFIHSYLSNRNRYEQHVHDYVHSRLFIDGANEHC